ncbi:hypothetical protein Tco_0532813 [Tanacetum coccineum]
MTGFINLRVERKLFVIEQPISPTPPTDSEYLRSGMRYMIHNELKSMFKKQAGVEWFKLSMLANRMRENQLAHMSLDEELCGTGMSWLCAPTRA